MSTSHSFERTHAIVIGGGIAGLLAARVLTEHFEQVTVVERDHYPDHPAHRPGVPQARHVHTMLLRGQRILEGFFPGFSTRLLEAGAIPRCYGYENLFSYGGRCPRIPPVLRGWVCSRLLLEWQIRQFLATYPSLHIKEGYEVVGLLFNQSTHAVGGVQLRPRGEHQRPTHSDFEVLEGDLVIDASGYSSRAPQWLRELGYEAPAETEVSANLGYATCTYDPPANPPEWKGIIIQSTRQLRRGGTLVEVENGRWMVALAGAGEENHPPTTPSEYLAFAKTLPDQALYEAIKEATPLTPIYGYRRIENRLRHFERLPRLPEGFLVMGDAVCTFNPVYGQGMTVAALEAQWLDQCLHSRKPRSEFTCTFQRNLPRVLTFAWRLATASDARPLEKRQTKGFSRRYMEALTALLPKDAAVLLTFLQVVHMIRSPLALVHPSILVKVVAQMYRQRVSDTTSRTN